MEKEKLIEEIEKLKIEELNLSDKIVEVRQSKTSKYAKLREIFGKEFEQKAGVRNDSIIQIGKQQYLFKTFTISLVNGYDSPLVVGVELSKLKSNVILPYPYPFDEFVKVTEIIQY